MKKLLILFNILIMSCFVQAQVRCAYSDHYTFVTSTTDPKEINKPCSVCYTNNYFSFYIPELGTRSFQIDQPIERSVSKDGIVTETIYNAEDKTMMMGDILVQIEYGSPTKTFSISYTKSDNTYIIESNGFIGDPEQSSNPTVQTLTKHEVIPSDSGIAIVPNVNGRKMSYFPPIHRHTPEFPCSIVVSIMVTPNGDIENTSVISNDSKDQNLSKRVSISTQKIKFTTGVNEQGIITWKFGLPHDSIPSCVPFSPIIGSTNQNNLAQNANNTTYKPPIFTFVEQMPTFPGGDAALTKFLQKNIQYPTQAKENDIEGSVIIRFVVDTNGNISDIEVLRDIGGGCGDEAIRVVKAMPQWIPGKQNGTAVNVQYDLPIRFQANN